MNIDRLIMMIMIIVAIIIIIIVIIRIAHSINRAFSYRNYTFS
jgi:uncharacterized membrane protein